MALQAGQKVGSPKNTTPIRFTMAWVPSQKTQTRPGPFEAFVSSLGLHSEGLRAPRQAAGRGPGAAPRRDAAPGARRRVRHGAEDGEAALLGGSRVARSRGARRKKAEVAKGVCLSVWGCLAIFFVFLTGQPKETSHFGGPQS